MARGVVRRRCQADDGQSRQYELGAANIQLREPILKHLNKVALLTPHYILVQAQTQCIGESVGERKTILHFLNCADCLEQINWVVFKVC